MKWEDNIGMEVVHYIKNLCKLLPFIYQNDVNNYQNDHFAHIFKKILLIFSLRRNGHFRSNLHYFGIYKVVIYSLRLFFIFSFQYNIPHIY